MKTQQTETTNAQITIAWGAVQEPLMPDAQVCLLHTLTSLINGHAQETNSILVADFHVCNKLKIPSYLFINFSTGEFYILPVY